MRAAAAAALPVAPPSDAVVLLSFGPPGGPTSEKSLKAKRGGRWEGWLPIPTTGAVVYDLTVRHPRASGPVRLGPYEVKVQ